MGVYAHPAARRNRPARRYEHQRPPLPLEWLIPILALFVVAAIGIGVLALRSVPSTHALQHDVSALRSEVGTLQLRLAAERTAVAGMGAKLASVQKASSRAASAGTVNLLSDRVDQLSANVHMLQVCTAQLEQALAGLGLRTSNVNGWVTGAALTKPAVISQACWSALTAAPGR